MRCPCERSVEYFPSFLQRRHRMPSDTLVFDLQFRLRAKAAIAAAGVPVSASRFSTIARAAIIRSRGWSGWLWRGVKGVRSGARDAATKPRGADPAELYRSPSFLTNSKGQRFAESVEFGAQRIDCWLGDAIHTGDREDLVKQPIKSRAIRCKKSGQGALAVGGQAHRKAREPCQTPPSPSRVEGVRL